MMTSIRIGIDFTPAVVQRGGVGRYTRSLVRALVRHADDTDSFTLWYAGGNPPDGRDGRYGSGAAERVRLRRLPLTERWLTLAWQRARLPLHVERLIGEVDVVHGPDFVAPPSRAPVVVTIHDLSYLITPEYAHPNLRRYLSAAVPRSLRRASRVVAVSRATAEDLIERYGIPGDRIAVIPNGVDPIFRQPEPAEQRRVLEDLGIAQPYFLIVGTIEPRKNHLTLLDAFEVLHETRPDAQLIIAGRAGWLSDPIMARIERLSRTLPLRYLATVSDATLPSLYAGSLALVYPSWYEGFGLPVAEALACGTAVITTERGALKEVAGDAALRVEPDDVEQLVDAMRRLYDDPSLRADLVRRGTQRATRLTWDRAAADHLRLYHEVAGRV